MLTCDRTGGREGPWSRPEGEEIGISSYAIDGVAPHAVSLLALRRRWVAIVIGGVAVGSFASAYAVPIAVALRTPGTRATLSNLRVPTFAFPALRIPSVAHRGPAAPAATHLKIVPGRGSVAPGRGALSPVQGLPPAYATRGAMTRGAATRVPVQHNRYAVVLPKKPKPAATDVPVDVDVVGAPAPDMPAASDPTPAPDMAAASDPTPAPAIEASGSEPQSPPADAAPAEDAQPKLYALQSEPVVDPAPVSGPPPAAAPPAVVAPPAPAPVTPPPGPQLAASGSEPQAPLLGASGSEPQSPVTVPAPAPTVVPQPIPDLNVPAVQAAGPPIARAADATVSTTVPLGSLEPPAIGSVPLGTHTPSGDAPAVEPWCPAVAPGAVSGAAAGGGASSSRPTAAGGESAAPCTPAPPAPTSADLPRPGAAAVPGSGPSPPAAWIIGPNSSSNTIGIAVVGDGLAVTLNGATTTRLLATITSLTVTGGDGADAFSFDRPVGIPVTFDGGAGDDTLFGPSDDTTWTVDGPGTGVVDGIHFKNFENLGGAPENEDTFVLEHSGSLAGTFDGGAGGFDSLVLDGSWHTMGSAPIDGHSGTLLLDGQRITYAGLEPITNTGSLTDVVFDLSNLADVATLTTSPTGLRLQSSGTFEVTDFAVPTGSITVNAGNGNDRFNVDDISAVYSKTITINGEGGSDTFSVPDVDGAFHVTAVDEGDWQATAGGPKVEFHGVENLVGAPTQDDAFDFKSGAGMTGTVDDGAGQLSVAAAGFVKVTGDYDFVHTTRSVDLGDGGSVVASVLTLSGTSGTGFIGVEPLDHPIGIEGGLSSFGLAIVTSGTRAWHVFSGTIQNPHFVIFVEFTTGLSNLTVTINEQANDDSYLNLGANPIDAGGVMLSYTAPIVAATTTFSLHISQFVHLSGAFTFGIGAATPVDVDTGITSASPAASAISSLPVSADCSGTTLARTADSTKICNLSASALTIAASGINVFVGYDPNLADDGTPSADAVGLHATNVNVGLVLFTAKSTGVATLDALKLRFYALKATAGNIELLGVPSLTLLADNITVKVNGGKAWALDPAASRSTVNFTTSFPSGYSIVTGGDPIVVDFAGKLIGASAQRVLFKIASFVYVSGSFSFEKGPTQYVDVRTGLPSSLSSAQLDGIFGTITKSDSDPGGTALARANDGSTIWNLPVSTIAIGLGGVDVFLGYTDSLDAAAADGHLTLAELEAAHAVGLFIGGADLGMLLMSAQPVIPAAVGLNAARLRFFAMKLDAASVAFVGVPELWIQATDLEVRVNQGSFTPGLWPPLGLAGSMPFVDFVASFGSGGFSIATGGDPVVLDFIAAVVGASANNVLFRVSDFVWISGGFSFDKGKEELVTVNTGLSGLSSAELTSLFGSIAVADSAPVDGSLARNADGSKIFNFPVATIQFGMHGVDVFVGYTDSLTAATAGGMTQASLEAQHAIGLFVGNVDLGMVLMRTKPVTATPLPPGGLNAALLKFFTLKLNAGAVALVGVPELWLSANNVEVRVNQGSYAPGVWAGLARGRAPPVVDFTATFGADGYQVRTDTAGHTVALKYTQPTIGASADKVLFRVSDFVYVSGGFSFDKGPVKPVAVRTGFSGLDALTARTLFGDMPISADAPADGSVARTADGSMIWNLPVSTIELGLHDVDVFLGYTDSLDLAAADGDLTHDELVAAHAIGLFLDNVSLGMVLMRAQQVSIPGVLLQPTGLNASFLKFFSLRVTAANVELLGVPELTLSANNLEVRVNQGSFVGPWTAASVAAGGIQPVIDFVASFGADGYGVRTNTAGDALQLKYTQPTIGASADRVLFRVSDFVFVVGGFSFDKGPVELVAVRTGITVTPLTAEPVFGSMPVSDTAPTDGSIARNDDGSIIWNLRVETVRLGLNGVDVFVGYSDGLDTAASDGRLTHDELVAAHAIGLFLGNVSLGMVMMRALPVRLTGVLAIQPLGLNASFLKFFALDVTASAVVLEGVPEIWLSGTNVQVRVNRGSFTGPWPAVPGISAPPVVDFVLSFGTGGYHVPTDTSGSFVAIKWDTPLIGASADNILLRISDFVYVTGSFSFNKGPVRQVDVKTGLSAIQAAPYIAALHHSNTDDGQLGIKDDGSMIWNLPVETIEIGLGHVDVFVGYTDSLDAAAADGHITRQELTDAHAIGLFLTNVTLGMVLMNAEPLTGTDAILNAAKLRFFALDASADNLGLAGIPEIILEAAGVEVKLNQGSYAPGWPAIPGGSPPVIDFIQSFGGDGYHVAINTAGDFRALGFTTPLIAGGAEKVTIQLSQFVYITGSIYFEKGPVMTVPLVGGLLGNPADVLDQLGITIPGDVLGLHSTEILTLTIGARNVMAFVGIHGPYWVDTNGDGIPNRGTDGQLVDSEVNHHAIGLVIDDLTFGILIGKPTNNLDPRSYVALKASAATIRLVGINGLVAQVDGLEVALNISSPTIGGLPLLPVIDFSSMPGGHFGVKSSPTTTVDLDMATALVRAKATWIQLDVFGVITLQGSIAFNLGPQKDVTLSDGSTAHLTTMTIGASHVSAFIGINGPYVLDKTGTNLSTTAIGIQITDLNLGLFVGTEVLSSNPSVFVAMDLDIKSFGLVHIPGVTLTGTLLVQLNLGAGLMSGGSAIDFVASFGTDGFAVETGDPTHPINLKFRTFNVTIQATAVLNVANFFLIDGAFSLQVDPTGLKLFAAGELQLGPDMGRSGNSLVSITALGVLIINGQGVAADLDVNLSLGIPDLGLTVTARVIVNTTGVDQSVVVPDRLLNILFNYTGTLSTLATTLKTRLVCTDPTQPGCTKNTYVVHGGAPKIFSSPGNPDLTAVAILLGQQTGTVNYEANGSYIVAILSGSFNFLNFASATGLAAISIRSGAFELIAQLAFTIGPLSFSVKGNLGIYDDGVIVNLDVAFSLNLLSLFDVNLSGQLNINTTGSNSYFRLAVHGDVNILSIIKVSGTMTIVVDHSAWSITVPQSGALTATFGPLSLSAYGNIQSNGHFDLTFTGSIVLGWDSTGISGSGTIHASFDGTNFAFSIGGSFSAKFAGINLFGISASGSVTGTLGQTVTFKVHVEGSGWFLETVLKVVRMTLDAAEDAGLAVVNFLGTLGCKIWSFFGGHCDEWVDVQKPENDWIEELKSFDITVATFTLPARLTNVTTPPPAPQLAGLNVGSGVLTLNVGALGGNRNVGKVGGTPIADEDYQISSLGPSSISGRSKLRVIAFGKTEDFDGVRSIFADFGDGTDSLHVMPGVAVPLEAHGGSGNDTLSYLGSSSAKLYGDGDDDVLAVGAAAAGNTATLLLDGGAGNDTLSNDSPSGATLTGGDGNDNILGGAGGDVISGGNGNDTLQGRGGADTVNGDGGDDLYREDVVNLVAGETFAGGTNVTSTVGDVAQLTGTTGSDDFRVTVSGSSVIVGRYSGATLLGSLTITTTEGLVLRGVGGGDSYSFTGALDLAGIKRVTADLSSGSLDTNGDGTVDLIAHAGADTVTLNLSNGDDVAQLGTSAGSNTTVNWAGHYVLTTINSVVGDGDVLTINALDGNDFLNGASVTGPHFAHTNLNGGAGNDSIAGTPDNDVIDSGPGNDTVSGGEGTDTYVDSSGDDTVLEFDSTDFGLWHNAFVMGTATLTGAGETLAVGSFGTATFEDPTVFEHAILGGDPTGTERNVFTVGGPTTSILVNGLLHTGLLPWTGGATLNGYGGDDLYIVELNGNAGGSTTVLEDGGGAGSDTLVLKGTDGNDTGRAETSDATTTLFTLAGGTSSATVTVAQPIELVSVYLRGGTDRFAVRSNNLPFTLDGGSSNDWLAVGSNADELGRTNTGGNLNAIDAALVVAGGAGIDLLTVDGSGDPLGHFGRLTSTALTGLGLAPGGVTYSGLETLNIALGSGSDTMNVDSTAGGVATMIDLGPGNDTVTIRSTAPVSTLTVTGGTGADWFKLVAAAGTVILNGNDGDDVFELGSNAAFFSRAVDSGGIVNGIAGAVTIDGGAPSASDSLYVDETGDASSAGNDGMLTATTLTGLGLGAGITYAGIANLTIRLGAGSTHFDIHGTSSQTMLQTGDGDDTVNASSDAPLNLGTVNTVAGPLTVDGQGGSDTLFVSDLGDALANSGRLTSSLLTGLGTAGITYAGIELLNIQLGAGDDRFDVLSTNASTVTTTRAGPGHDTVNVSSDAPANLGTVAGIAGHLIVDGEGGSNTLNVSDAGNTGPSVGTLTSTDLTGLGTAGITYAGLETLNLQLGSGSDVFSVQSTFGGALTTLLTGSGDDTVNVSSDAATVAGIAGHLIVDGQGGSDTMNLSDAGNPAGNAGTLTSTDLIGLGTAGITYAGLKFLTVQLGSGGDAFSILSTHAGTTIVNGGPGDDALVVETIAGPTFVNGQGGNDAIAVNPDTVSPSAANGIGALLTLDGGANDDAYRINTFGNGDSEIRVLDSGGGVDTLTIEGTAAADQFLFRHDLVASLTGFDGSAYTHAERIVYNGAVESLTVDGLTGDDRFAFDDNSSATTVNGGDGNDLFQVGQLYGQPVLLVWPVDFTTTTRGDLSNGVSFATALNGGADGDTFSIFHNRAPLSANGGAGDDSFVIRTFLGVDEHTSVDAGEGIDTVRYVQNAPVSIDGGDGFDTLLVIGTEGDDTFVITATSISGTGIDVSYVNVESLTLDGTAGDDHFIVLGTGAGVVTTIYGGLGGDTIDVGDGANGLSNVAGPLIVDGRVGPATPAIPPPVLLPGESSSALPIPANPSLNVIEPNQVDTLNANAGAVTSPLAGLLDSTTLTGLGMAVGITYSNLEAVALHLGSGADAFRIASTHGGTTLVTGGAGNDSFQVETISGPTAIDAGAGDDTVRVGHDGTVDELDALLALEGGAGTDALVVDDSADTNDNLGTLTQTTLTGLDMVARAGVDRVYTVTPGAGGITIAIGALSANFGAGTSAADVQAGLQQLLFPGATCGTLGTSRCAQSVFVWAFGGDYLIGFQGELGGLAAPAVTGAPLRLEGLNYYDFETLAISLGSGNDRFNVRGTLPATTIDTGGGDDVVYVSDRADLGALAGAAAASGGDLAVLNAAILDGSLDLILGALAIDTATGSNTLGVSDRLDPNGDTAVTLAAGVIIGLAPAAITYAATGGDLGGQGYWAQAADSGLFGHGIAIYGGTGGSTFSIVSVFASDLTPAPFATTSTTLFAGEGGDQVTISAAAGPGRLLVVDGQGGDDTIDASAAALPLTAFGEGGSDELLGGSGSDYLFGDFGRVVYLRPPAAGGYDVWSGGGPVATPLAAPVSADAFFTVPDALFTFGTAGAHDVLAGNAGDDYLLGGGGADTVDGGRGNNVVFGDCGRIVLDRGLLVRAETTEPYAGAADAISAGSGDDIVFGGASVDTIVDTGGHNIVFGDFGFVAASPAAFTEIAATDPASGDGDVITITGAGANVVIGGAGGDVITTGPSDDLVFGDFGRLTGTIPLAFALPSGPAPYVYESTFTRAASGDDDTISVGDGRNVVIGGQGGDTIRAGSGDDDLIGGSNVAGAADGGDRIDGGAGNDVIAGDNALILRRGDAISLRIRSLTEATIYSVDAAGHIVANIGSTALADPDGIAGRTIVLYDAGTTDATTYGNDALAGGAGHDLLFGQMGNDTIHGDASIDVPAGTSAAAASDGNDYAEGGGGNDVIYGDLGQDDLIGGSSSLYIDAAGTRTDGNDVIFGGAGTLLGRNEPGDSSVDAHGRDADVIAGDDANIFRLVGTDGRYLSYPYDTYGGLRIVPRAVVLLDYGATDPASVGAGDFLYGEGGDDVIHGQTGADTIFGGPQDDQLYGEAGGDWISGGTGDDGILGDDGLLLASRNGVPEPLSGIAAMTPVTLEQADEVELTVNITGELHYTAILTPFAAGGNDILYGGLGNDSMHGGAGDDAMSGAEALPFYYGDGRNPLAIVAAYYSAGNVLGYDPATTMFRWYNAADPLRKIVLGGGVDFLLNFESQSSFDTGPTTTIDDGKDVLFGDGGNDWLVGGTNQDFLFGGTGDDLLQADDNLDSTKVTGIVTYASLTALTNAYAASIQSARALTNELLEAQRAEARGDVRGRTRELTAFMDEALGQVGSGLTADQAAVLQRLARWLLSPDPLANDTPDPKGSGVPYADLAFGGAGRDVLIGNTSSDRLIDWSDEFNTYAVPWNTNEGQGDNGNKRPLVDRYDDELAEFLVDLGLSAGADPTRGNVLRGGEPNGELGLVGPSDPAWAAQSGRERDEEIDVVRHSDRNSLGYRVVQSPSIRMEELDELRLDSTSEALLHRIAIRGRLTAAEESTLDLLGRSALGRLIAFGLVARSNGAVAVTDALLLATGYADPPRITSVSPPAATSTTTPVTVSGTGDAGDFVTLYDGSTAIGTATVRADGTWSLTVSLAVGTHTLSATQTVHEIPHAGLTSSPSCSVKVTVKMPSGKGS